MRICSTRSASPSTATPCRSTRAADEPSGLRIGTPALATRGFGDAEFTEVADIIATALARAPTRTSRRCGARVSKLAQDFPLYDGLENWGLLPKA